MQKKALTTLFCYMLILIVVHHAKAQSGKQDSRLQTEQHNIRANTWREGVWTTTFWIGQSAQKKVPGSSCNSKSAWEKDWVRAYGGYDHPTRRIGYRPAAFIPKQNPFYVALPYNDLKDPKNAPKWIPWWKPGLGRWTSQVKGKWIAIQYKDRIAYAQWKDVGPWVTHDPEYVFGGKKHKGKAGLDVSPAVRDYLGMNGSGYTRWRFVEDHEVPDGPWLEYGDAKLLVLAARQRHKLYSSNTHQNSSEKQRRLRRYFSGVTTQSSTDRITQTATTRRDPTELQQGYGMLQLMF